MRVRNTTSRQTFPIHATSLQQFCSFNFTGRFVARRGLQDRFISVRSMGIRQAGQKLKSDVGAWFEQALAGSAENDDGRRKDGCDGHH